MRKSKTVEQARASLVETEDQVQIDVERQSVASFTRRAFSFAWAQLSQETARENLRVSTNKVQSAGGAFIGCLESADRARRCRPAMPASARFVLDGQS